MFGIDIWAWSLILLVFVGGWHYGRTTLRLQLRIAKQQREFKAMVEKRMLPVTLASGTAHRISLPPREKVEQKWNKMSKSRFAAEQTALDRASGHGAFNAWADWKNPNVIPGTTGCELTDEIFAAADRADIIPSEFFDELERKNI